MCASSSTTRTLKLNGAIPSIHHDPVIRMSDWRDELVNTASPPRRAGRAPRARSALGGWGGPLGGWGGTSVRTGPQNELQRIPGEPEPLPDRLLQVPAVREMQQTDVVHEHHNGRCLGACLCCVAEFQTAALEAGRRVLVECLPEDLVELVRRHLDPALTDHLERGGNHGPEVLLRLRG